MKQQGGGSTEASASPGSTWNLIMKLALVEVPAGLTQTPESLSRGYQSRMHSSSRFIFLAVGFLLCSETMSAWRQSSCCTSFKINSSQTMMKTGRKGDEGKWQINHTAPVFSTYLSSTPYLLSLPSCSQLLCSSAPQLCARPPLHSSSYPNGWEVTAKPGAAEPL